MDKILRIAWTEYLNAVRSKAFLISILMLPVMMFGGILIPKLIGDKVDTKDRRLAVWDRSGQLAAFLAAQAREHNERETFEVKNGQRGKQIQPAFLIQPWQPRAVELDQAELVLSDRVRKGDFFAFLIIGKDAVSSQAGPDASISYYTETPTFTALPNWIERQVNEEIKRLRLETAKLDRGLIGALTRNTPVEKLGLAKAATTGEVIKAEKENKVATFAIPFGSMFLLFMLVLTSAPALLSTVLEEKIQKIAEILLASVSPFELMLGKLLGAVLVSFSLSVLYLGAIIFALWNYGLLAMIPPSHFVLFLLLQFLALMIYGSFFSAIGAACSEIRDAQNMMAPAMILIMVPLFVWMPVMQSPASTFSRVLSLVPPLTPLLMMLRVSIPPGPPWWEITLGVVLTIAYMLVCVWASAKVFRIGLLSQGQAPSFKRLLGWVCSR